MHKLYRQRRQFTLQDLVLIGGVVLLTTIALRLGFPPVVAVPLASMLIFVLLLLIIIYSLNVRRTKQNSQNLLASELWVHWRYPSDEWERLTNTPQLRMQTEQQAAMWRSPLIRNAVSFSIAFALMSAFLFRNDGWLGLVGAIFAGLVVFGLFLRSAFRVQRSLAHPYAFDAQDATDIYISAHGMIMGSNLILFTRPRIHIVDAAVIQGDPSILRISLQYMMGRRRAIPYDLMLPIPDGHEAEAQTVVDRFHTTFVQGTQ